MGLGAMEIRAQVGGDWGREGDSIGGGLGGQGQALSPHSYVRGKGLHRAPR